MPVNSFSCHIQQTCWKAPSPSPSPRWSPGKYSLSFQLQNTELWVPDLQVFQRSPLTPQKHLHLFWRYWAPSLLNLWVLQVQLLVYFDDATRLQWKIPLPPSSFLLPYYQICFIFNYQTCKVAKKVLQNIKSSYKNNWERKTSYPNLLHKATGSSVPWGKTEGCVLYIWPARLP